MELTLLAAAVLAGIHWQRVALLAAAAHIPAVVALWLGWLVLRRPAVGEASAAVFCQTAAAELRSGASLRASIGSAAAASGRVIRSDAFAAPIENVARDVAETFSESGTELMLTIRAAHRTGGRAAEILEEVADMALARAEIARETRIATAPARATAGILLLAPCSYFVFIITTDRLSRLLAEPEQRVVIVLGLGLFLAGLLAAVGVMWRAR